MASRLRELPPSGHGRARGLVSSRRSGSRIEAHSFAPPDDLADVIESFWVGRWDLRGQVPHVTELLGDPCVHVVAEAGSSRVVGVWTRRWIRRLEGRGQVRAAKLRVGAVRAFVPVPAVELTDRLVPLAELLPLRADELERAVLEPSDDLEALERLAERLRALRDPGQGARVAEAVAVAEHLRDPDVLTVEALAERSGLPIRTLQRLFREHVGAPPKALLRRIRLQEAALSIERGRATSLARLAAELGYTDQAHLTRDFRAVVGVTPGQLGRRLRD